MRISKAQHCRQARGSEGSQTPTKLHRASTPMLPGRVGHPGLGQSCGLTIRCVEFASRRPTGLRRPGPPVNRPGSAGGGGHATGGPAYGESGFNAGPGQPAAGVRAPAAGAEPRRRAEPPSSNLPRTEPLP